MYLRVNSTSCYELSRMITINLQEIYDLLMCCYELVTSIYESLGFCSFNTFPKS